MDRQQHIKLALTEDQYKKDITTKILPLDKKCKAIIKAKESFHIYGLKWFSDVFKSVNKSTKIKLKVKDGDLVKKNNSENGELNNSQDDNLDIEQSILKKIKN